MLFQLPKLIILLVLFFFSASYADNPWKLIKKEEGIQVYERNNPKSPLKTFRGVTYLSDTTLSTIMAVLNDVTVMPKLLHNCQSAKKIKEVKNKTLTMYLVTKMPWPVKNRDAVIYSTVTQDKETKRILLTVQSKSKLVPLKRGMVRIRDMSGYWEFIPIKDGINGGKVKVTYELSIDPGGNLPKWLVNTLAVDFPFYTLKNLQGLVLKPVYRKAKYSNIIE